MAAKPTRPSIPDMLENASHALDELIRDARLPIPRGRHDHRHGDLEERAQAIAASIVASFRGSAAASAPPIMLETDGRRTRALF
ncbi:hypothetical protein [Sphingobium sp.]|uniref:hypothetical protein n=1 Tax=Sphingobium sp. TaxID=1912891 RepID=UPI002E1E7C65